MHAEARGGGGVLLPSVGRAEDNPLVCIHRGFAVLGTTHGHDLMSALLWFCCLLDLSGDEIINK